MKSGNIIHLFKFPTVPAEVRKKLKEQEAAVERKMDLLIAGLSFEERIVLSRKLKGGD